MCPVKPRNRDAMPLSISSPTTTWPRSGWVASIDWVSGSLSLVIHDHEYSRACPIRLATTQLLAPVLSEQVTTDNQEIDFSFRARSSHGLFLRKKKVKQYLKAQKIL
jgi:hypothetical protein